METTIRPEDIRRGDMFYYDFPAYGDVRYEHLIRDRHRVLVIQNNAANRSTMHDRVVVCPISSARAQHLDAKGAPKRRFQAILSPKDCIGDEPLDHPSIVHLEEMYTLSKADCARRLCSITAEALRRVDSALVVSLDLANQVAAEALEAIYQAHTDLNRVIEELGKAWTPIRDAIKGIESR